MSVAVIERSFSEPGVIVTPDGILVADADFRWADLPAAGWIGDDLAAMPLKSVSTGELLDAAGAWEKIAAWAAGNSARVLAEFDARRDAELEVEADEWELSPDERDRMLEADEAAAEVSLALHLAPGTARHRIQFARDLVERLPATVAAMCAGAVSWAKAKVLAEQSLELDPEQTAALEQKVLRWSAGKTPGQLRAKVRREILRIDPDAVRRRAAKAAGERHVELIPRANGMADLTFHLSGVDAVAVYNWLDEIARGLKSSGGETRTLDQLRADALVDLVLQRSTTVAKRPLVQIMLPAGTIAGGDGPGELAGYGPIDADLARQLAADGTWQRIITDPAIGAVQHIDPKRYVPPAALRAYVQGRDRTCRFPTCSQPAHRCDIDHTIPFHNGKEPGTQGNPGTVPENLGVLCRRHHRLKDRRGSKWRLRQDSGGRFIWTTPEGLIHRVDAEPSIEPEPTPEAEREPEPMTAPAIDDSEPPPY